MTDYPQQENQYSDEEEFQDNYLDEQREAWDESGAGQFPAAKKQDSLFTLFSKVWRTKDSSKVGNLDREELGNLGFSVRDSQHIAFFADFLGHKGVSSYFNRLGEITLATSMSKKGWFVELFVTSKKFAHKGTLGGGSSVQARQSKWRIFGRTKNQPAQEEQA